MCSVDVQLVFMRVQACVARHGAAHVRRATGYHMLVVFHVLLDVLLEQRDRVWYIAETEHYKDVNRDTNN